MPDYARRQTLQEIKQLLLERPSHIRLDDLEVLLRPWADHFDLRRTNYSRRVIYRLSKGEFCPAHTPGSYMMGHDQAKHLLLALKRVFQDNQVPLRQQGPELWKDAVTGEAVEVLLAAQHEQTGQAITVFKTLDGQVLWSADFDQNYARQASHAALGGTP